MCISRGELTGVQTGYTRDSAKGLLGGRHTFRPASGSVTCQLGINLYDDPQKRWVCFGPCSPQVRIVPDTSKWCQECTLDVVMGLDSLEGFPSTCSVTRRDGKQTQASTASQGLLQSAFWVSISGTRLKITWAFLEISDRNVEQRRVKKIQTAVEGPSLHACTRPLTVLVLGGRHASVCLA